MTKIKYNMRRAGKLLLLIVLIFATCNITAQGQQRGGGGQRGGQRSVNSQPGQVLEGRIVNSKGEPIPGAIINIAEQSRIVLSDNNGQFSMKDVRLGDELIVSSIGYKNATFMAEFTDRVQVVMEDDVDEYSLTLPVPFGRKPKKLITESTSVVTGSELEKHPITILQNAFTTTVSGVATYEWSSEPGWSETEIYIRGLRTQNQWARRPLIMVDNVERDLTFLDAFPIESITILKDAAAASIYGMKGANGVILVTTKRGESGKTKISFTQEIGTQRHTSRAKNQNSYDMALTRNQVRKLSGQPAMYTEEQIEKYRRVVAGETLEGVDKYKYFNTDWFDDLYRDNAPQTKTNLQISGGGANTRYYVSFSNLFQDGVWNKEYADYNAWNTQARLNRWNLRSNVDIDVNRFLNVSLDLGGRMDYIQQPNTSVFNLVTFGAVEANPMEPKKTPEGLEYCSSTAQSPLRYIAGTGLMKNRRRNVYSTVNLTGDMGDWVKGLKAYATVSFDSYETYYLYQSSRIQMYNYNYSSASVTDVSQFVPVIYQTYQALQEPTGIERDNVQNINFHSGLLYDFTSGKHFLKASAFVRSFKNNVMANGNTGTGNPTQSGQSSNRFLSLNAQAMYVYNDRYIVTGNISRMGTDNFDPDNRWGLFGGGSLGWVLSDEPWLKNDKINLLKLRASFGRVGQSETTGGTDRYPYQNSYSTSTGASYAYNFGTARSTIAGYYESRAGNRNSLWELSDMFNVGVDFDFLSKKLYGSIDAFKEWRSNILVNRSNIPDLMGVTVNMDSYGKIESKGFEVTLGHHNQLGNFRFYIETMLTYNTNKIIDLDETPPNVPWQARVGDRIRDRTSVSTMYESSFPGHRTVGGWNMYRFVEWATDPNRVATSHQDAIDNPNKYPYNTASGGNQTLGTAVFKDLDGDRKIDVNDMEPNGFTIIPELIPSFTLGLGYKGFDARVVVNAYLNRSVFISPAMAWSGWGNMGTQEVVNVWGYYTDDPNDPRNVNARWPRPVYGGYEAIGSDRSTGTYQNDIWIVNGDYWSLRNVEIGYSFPKKLIAKAYLTNLRIYLNAYNVATWSKDVPSILDPDKPMSYCWWYPKVRTYSFGLNISF